MKSSIRNDGPSNEKKKPRVQELDGGDSKKKRKQKCTSASSDEEPKGFDQEQSEVRKAKGFSELW